MHTYTYNVNNVDITFMFDDKRTLNSLIKAIEKANSININSKPEYAVKVETPQTFEGWQVVTKAEHVALKPPSALPRESIKLCPTLSVNWTPEFTGQYRNDGMYHFFPTKTKLSTEFSKEDMVENFKLLGAV